MGRITGKFDTKDIAFAFYWCRNRRCNVCPLREIDPNKEKCKKIVRDEVFSTLGVYSELFYLHNEPDKAREVKELRNCYKYCSEDGIFYEDCEKCKWRDSDICFNLTPNITNALMDYAEE